MKFFVPVPIDPLSQAKCVAAPKIKEVIDLDEGVALKSVEFIERYRYAKLVETRGDILCRMNGENPWVVCAVCHVPVHLICAPDRSAFSFRHQMEDGSCPAQTRSPLSEEQILARKYHGLRESEPHKRIKALVLRSLEADPAFRDTISEKKWKSSSHPKRFRRPDVRSVNDNGKYAFEIQLSTTFLSVVVGRRDFYRTEGALLVWVLGSFDPSYRLMTTDDLLFSNKSNIIVVDEETAELSERLGQFHVRCHFREPVRDGAGISDIWKSKVVPFALLEQNRASQQVFYIDYDAAHDALQGAIDAERKAAVVAEIADASDALFEFWKAHGNRFRHTSENRVQWGNLRDRFEEWDIFLPEYPDSDFEFQAMLHALYSAREGAPVGYKFSKLIQVAHQIAESYPKLLVAFGYAVNISKDPNVLALQDSTGKWRERIAGKDGELGISARMRMRDPLLAPNPALLPVMSFLFPEVGEKVRTYLGL